MLSWCNHCKEYSAVVKCYTRKADGERKRVIFCLNKGCGMKQDITYPKAYSVSMGVKAVMTVLVVGLLVMTNSVARADNIKDVRASIYKELSAELIKKIDKLEELASKEGIIFRITCGYRSPEEQARLYAQGRTTKGKIVTKVKHSKHNDGLAFDVVIIKNNQVSWNGEDYFRIGEIGQALGLTWGGAWRMRDYCHFELAR
jgi:hypothetical protein